MKILRVGDPHVRVSNIDESDALISFIADLAIKENVDRIEFLGDQFHTHAILRLEVVEFWYHAFQMLSDICPVVALTGNHDQSGDNDSSFSAMDIYKKLKNVEIIGNARPIGHTLYVPYIHDHNKFIATCNNWLNEEKIKYIVCHQTFDGSKFENGFYAPDGIDSNLINCSLIISGHIHAQQRLGKVIYPGTARWDSVSDANQEKGVWIFEHDDLTGAIVSEKYISTESVCSPIYSFDVHEGMTIPEINPSSRTHLKLIGSSEWIKKCSADLKGKVMLSSKCTDKKERRAINNTTLEQFLNKHINPRVISLAKELSIV